MSMPMVSSTIDDRSANVAHTIQLTRLPISRRRKGVGPSPNLATSSPPATNAMLMNPHKKPHASTDTNDSP